MGVLDISAPQEIGCTHRVTLEGATHLNTYARLRLSALLSTDEDMDNGSNTSAEGTNAKIITSIENVRNEIFIKVRVLSCTIIKNYFSGRGILNSAPLCFLFHLPIFLHNM